MTDQAPVLTPEQQIKVEAFGLDKPEHEEPAFASAYVVDGKVQRVHFQRCWSCMCMSHFDEPKWHTWADEDDVDFALKAGQPNPSNQRCGCWCAEAEL